MMTTTVPAKTKLTLGELEGLGAAETLPSIQNATAGPSTTSPESMMAQLQKLPGYKELTEPDDDRLGANLLGAKVESEQEPDSSLSGSEDDHDAQPRALDISEKRKAQNNKFSAWCVVSSNVTSPSVNVRHIYQVVKARSKDYE